MMKAATGGQVQRVAYLYYDLQHVEVVRIEYEHAHGGGVREIPGYRPQPAGIAGPVIDGVKGVSLE